MIRFSIGFFVVVLAAAGGCSSPADVSGHGDMSGGGDGGSGPLAVAPSSVSLAFGQTQTFSANRAVSWSIVEAGGGTIDDNGTYTAPFSPGTYHVHAASTEAPAEEATATVNVADHSLALVAGSTGGTGTADGVGGTARFWVARGPTFDGTRYVYIADGGAVRRFDVGTGEVTTVAGRVLGAGASVDGTGAAAGFGLAWGLALDGAGGLYVSDESGDTIRKIDLSTRAVTTVAGAAGAAGLVNAMGTAARFRSPTGLAFDAAGGRLFIGDANNGAVRVYDVATTMVTTLSSSLTQPDGLAWDGASGTLYVVDAVPRQLFAIDVASKSTNVLAGAGRGFRDGPAASAHFDTISGIALAGGALYVSDTLGVRKLDLGGGAVTTLPIGGGAARSMLGVVADAGGKLLVTVGSDANLVRLDPASGASTVVAGPPGGGGRGALDGTGTAARFFDPGDVAVAPGGGVYISDVGNSQVRTLDLGTAAVGTLVGTPWKNADVDGAAGKGRTVYPTSVASDHAGTLYVVEPNENVVRKWVAATGTLTTIAGRAGFPGVTDGVGAAARFDQPIASCVDGGALYVLEEINATVRKVTLADGTVETIAGLGEEPGRADGVGPAARFSSPLGIACDGAGHVYVADSGNFAIRRVDVATKTVDTVAGALGVSGFVDMPGAAARFTSPAEMVYDAGFLYVVDDGYANLHLRKVQVGGTFAVQTIATSTLAGQQFYGVAVDAGGNVYVSNKQFGGSTVSKVSAGALAPFAGSTATGNGLVIDGIGVAANFFGAAGMAFDGGALWVAEPQADVVRRIDVATAAVTTPLGVSPDSPEIAGTGAGAFVYQPGGLAFAGGALLVADATSIDQVTLPGAVLTVAAGKVGYGGGTDGVGAAAAVWPAAMIADGGVVYFTGANSVRRYDPKSGQVDTLAGKEGTDGSDDGVKDVARFSGPKGIAADGAGNLYVSDTSNHTIRKVVIATGEVSTLAGTAGSFGASDGVGAAARFYDPAALVWDGAGNLYIADSSNGAVRRLEVATRAVGTYVGVLGERALQPGALPAHLNAPRGLALLPDGGLVITDEQAVLVVH